MDTLKKYGNELDSHWGFSYEKPSVCPYCGFGTDSTTTDKILWNFNEDDYILVINTRCTKCGKQFLYVSEFKDKKDGVFATMYPQQNTVFQNSTIQSVSERFIDLYNQSLDAEKHGSFELASFGYRAALEILVKDYAIKELGYPVDEVVKKSLFQAIGEYLKDDSLINSADVIRILGNDYAHYERKYPEHDFTILKLYMDIFIKLIETKLLIAHPPVHR